MLLIGQRLNCFSQFLDLLPQLGNFEAAVVNRHARRGFADILAPGVVEIEINFFCDVFPLLHVIIIFFAAATVPSDSTCLASLNVCDDDKKRGVYDAHYGIVDLGVIMIREPPFKWEYQENDLKEIERCGNSQICARLNVAMHLRGMKTFSSGARVNCIVFRAKIAIYSSMAFPEISSYALL